MMKCIAIDDEPLALRQLGSYIAADARLELIASFTNALAARDFLAEHEVDLIFVDINMPDLNGLDLVRGLERKCLVVFTTAYAEYALEGFRLDAVDYLLKPFGRTDFQRAASKAQSLHELLLLARRNEEPSADSGASESAAAAETESEAMPGDGEFLSIKTGYKVSLVRIAEIVYIESVGEYVRLHLLDGSTVMTLFRLKNMEAALPEGTFMRVHRSFIVNLHYITGHGRGRVYIGEDEYLPVGENYRAAFQEYLDRHLRPINP